MSKVAVKPELLRWARERSGVTFAALVERFPKYEAWESGDAPPTLKQLEQLAKKTTTPFGYFFLTEPPEETLPVPDFRTVRDRGVPRPSPNLMETIQAMQRRQAWMRDFLREEEEPPLPFIGSVTLEDDIHAVALAIRQHLGVTPGWAQQHRTWAEALRALRLAVEDAGVLVVFNGIVGNNTSRKLDPQEFRGFVLCDKWAPLIFVNNADATGAQMFTLAHELAHLWLGTEGVFGLDALQPADDDAERFCNRVAAEFLVPAKELEALWPEATRQDDPFQHIARRFKVSGVVGARRALDLGLLDQPAFLQFYRDYLSREKRKTASKGGDFWATQGVRIGNRFGSAVVRAVKEGRLLYTDAYRLTGLRGKTFNKFVEAMGLKVGA